MQLAVEVVQLGSGTLQSAAAAEVEAGFFGFELFVERFVQMLYSL
jgi:hypothetical protein